MTTKNAFVIMPFKLAKPRSNAYRELGEEELDTIYGQFEAALALLGYSATRSSSPTDILREIVLKLDSSDLVLADITSLNPNVMYELGIRHALCKKTIMVTQDINELPFDLRGYATIQYGWDTRRKQLDFQEKLATVLQSIESESDPRFGPVHTHLGIKRVAMDDYEHKTTVAKLERLFHEIGFLLTGTHSVLEELPKRFPKVYRKSKDGWDCLVKDVPHEVWQFLRASLNPAEVSTPSIDLLLATGYIGSEYNKYGEINEFVWTLHTIKTMHMHVDRGTAFYYSTRMRLLGRVQIMCMQIRLAVVRGHKGEKIFDLEPEDTFFKEQMFPDGEKIGESTRGKPIDAKVLKQLGIMGQPKVKARQKTSTQAKGGKPEKSSTKNASKSTTRRSLTPRSS